MNVGREGFCDTCQSIFCFTHIRFFLDSYEAIESLTYDPGLEDSQDVVISDAWERMLAKEGNIFEADKEYATSLTRCSKHVQRGIYAVVVTVVLTWLIVVAILTANQQLGDPTGTRRLYNTADGSVLVFLFWGFVVPGVVYAIVIPWFKCIPRKTRAQISNKYKRLVIYIYNHVYKGEEDNKVC